MGLRCRKLQESRICFPSFASLHKPLASLSPFTSTTLSSSLQHTGRGASNPFPLCCIYHHHHHHRRSSPFYFLRLRPATRFASSIPFHLHISPFSHDGKKQHTAPALKTPPISFFCFSPAHLHACHPSIHLLSHQLSTSLISTIDTAKPLIFNEFPSSIRPV